ncbi:MAG: DUF4440 domain-containing protein [Verrucomicrobia bacterium]|nr:DUF4440 domain-containing protein [Verrucomicrobiota bacterium]
MKVRLLLAVVGLAISFAVPTFGQEQSAVDPETRQEIEAVEMQYVEAYNKHDAATIAALYTQDAVRMEDWSGGELRVGREAIEKGFAVEFTASVPRVVPAPKGVQRYAIEDRIVSISEYSQGPFHGHSLKIFVRDADTWKIRMEFVTARWEHK